MPHLQAIKFKGCSFSDVGGSWGVCQGDYHASGEYGATILIEQSAMGREGGNAVAEILERCEIIAGVDLVFSRGEEDLPYGLDFTRNE